MATFYYAKRPGYIRTPEIRKKNSESLLGRKLSENTKIKISKGGKGKKRTSITKQRISEAKKHYWAEMTIEQKRERLKTMIPKKGRIPWNKGNRSKEYYEAELARNTIEYANFRKTCFERDLYSCCVSGQKGGNLVVHHLYSFSDYPEIRFLVDNGVTMSKEKHNEFHSIYGKRHNNLTQFIEFMGDMK